MKSLLSWRPSHNRSLGSLLISGPPGSGKSRAALTRFLAGPNSTLLTPTATIADHVRDELARANLPVRPNRIKTLAKFIQPFTPFEEAPESLIHLLQAQGVLFFEDELAHRGMAIRETRIATANPAATEPIIIDGFFALSPGELAFLEKLAAQTNVTITLPIWPGSSEARARLLQIGFEEVQLEALLRHPATSIQAALSLEQEVEQIALGILDHHARGREFREMGVLLRSRDPYASALETIFARVGIPARFHFTDPLSAHPSIQYLTGIVHAHLTGWDDADLLKLLRMPVSGRGATPEGDALDFKLRESIPSRTGPRPVLRISATDQTPQTWSAQLRTLRDLIPQPEITGQIDHEQLQIWRSTAAALNAFEKVLDTTAAALDNEKLSLANFWSNVETALNIEKLRIPDRRRNVVNVLDVYEAREWELSIAFVPGLNERIFPQHHRDDRQHEERFLFELATTRATEETILSYARFNEKGDPQLRSFFLEQEGVLHNPLRIQVGQGPDLSPTSSPLTIQHPKLAPTAIEAFLQCPFQFFAKRTLKLRKPPEKPRDRLNALVQGTILHRALAEGQLDHVFEEECEKHNIPATYRKEAVRLELLRHFEAFQKDTTWPLNWPRKTEQEFEVALTPALTIRGRIDRLDIGPQNEAIVIDYKYSAAAKIRERIEGDPLQAGLYLLAAERVFHLKPSGMFYCGLRQSVSWEGWHAHIPGLALGESRKDLHELIESAGKKAIEVHESITAGNIAVRPADRAKCRYCDYNAICRIESLPRAQNASS